MNYLITESQSSIVRRELKRSIEEIGFWRTKKKFRLNMDQMDNLLSGEYFPELSCGSLADIISELFKNGLVDRSYETKNYKIVLSSDSMSGSIEFVCTDLDRGDTIYGYATPYWDNECKLPLDLSYYSYLDIETGKIKTKMGGSSGGHNGIKSIDDSIGPDYNRIRIGIGHPGDKELVDKHVLNDFTEEEKIIIDQVIKKIFKNINLLIEKKLDDFTSKSNQ